MSKYCGKIGYAFSTETSPGVYEDKIVERMYYGDVLRHSSRRQGGDKVVDDITVSNEISILADPYAYTNFAHMKYATFACQKWTITSVDVEEHRLILSLGGVYNE